MEKYINTRVVDRVFIDEFAKIPSVLIDDRIEWTAAREAIIQCVKGISVIPAADVRENIHAKWVIEKEIVNGVLHVNQFCSNCGYPQYTTTKFCPDCGAVMDKGREE